jgi:hypothetical protein
MDYAKYLEMFNSGERRELLSQFCTDDVIFEAGTRQEIHRGRDEVTRFLLGLQSDFREVLRPQVVIHGKDHLFVEADVDLEAKRDVPDYPGGVLRKGGRITMKAFVVYYLRDGKICRFKTALWPPNFGVAEAPATL